MSIQERITKMIVEHLGVEESRVVPEISFVELGADSLDRTELIMNLEEEFNLEIPDAHGEKILTVKDAIDYIEEKLA